MSEPIGQLEQLISSIDKLTAAILSTGPQSGPVSAPVTPDVTVKTLAEEAAPAENTSNKKTSTGRKNASAKKADDSADKPVHSKQEVLDAVVTFKDTLGAPAARELLAKHGFAKLADVNDPKRYDALYDEATAALADLPADDSEPEDEI